MTRVVEVPDPGDRPQVRGPLPSRVLSTGPSRARRLAALEPSAALDRLAHLAARLLGTASAQVSIISDVQTVLAGAGSAEAPSPHESPAEESLCTVTVGLRAPLVVDDAVHDDRVSSLPPVTSGQVSAYLGVPLVDASGQTVGALCVYGDEPREWSGSDVSLLEELAGPVMAELELIALSADYESDRIVWELAMDAGGVGAFDWDIATGDLRWDDQLLRMFGHDHATFAGTIEAFNSSVHPDDLASVSEALDRAVESCGTYEAEYRVVLPHGEVRWITARGRVVPGQHAKAARLLGAAYDSTSIRAGDARVARVLEAMPSAFFQLDTEWRFAYVNAVAVKLLGASRDELLGAGVWDLFPEALGTDFETHYRQARETGEPVAFEAYYPPPLDAWFEIRAWPTPDGLSVYFFDVTERHTAHDLLEDSARRASAVAAAGEALTGTLDADEAVSRLASSVVPALGEWCVVSLVDVDGPDDLQHRVRDTAAVHADPAMQPVVERYRTLRLPALRDGAFLARALTHGEVVEIPADATERVVAVLATEEAQQLCRELAPESAMVLPLRARGRTVGMLSLFRGRSLSPFSRLDRETLTEISTRAGLALDNARLYAAQRELAEGLQRSLMTAPPETDHLRIEVRYESAAQAAQVGGDWYDAFLQQDGTAMLVIGDVVGHDTAAAASMGQVRGLLRGIAVHTGQSPAAVLAGVDQVMQTLQVDVTATAVLARLEGLEDGRVRLLWSNAGHPPPMVIEPDGAVSLLASAPELLLGVQASTDRSDQEATLERGSTVLLYTDGLVERRGQLLDDGLLKLHETLTELAAEHPSLGDLCDRVLRRMVPDRSEDDVAITAVRLV